ncbi:hypothetical protein HYDPIDRAFT_117496 [Hydnomerulius pinastri MD-312]|uniref:Uncharacterized protein n=1 Tax=Hydnomerulius pinastri MD-312 TaxID=994086 RepID=A0A0C9W2M8_9AGAM|nr:hypothetical protein HYDPIDRAFT_117496 [Hydnomerulius pinastri MD-312]
MDHRNILPDSEKPSYDSAVFPLESDSESSKVERGGRRSKRNRGHWNSLLRPTNVRVIWGSRFSAIEVFDRKLDIRLDTEMAISHKNNRSKVRQSVRPPMMIRW